jgi:hypothetical protein
MAKMDGCIIRILKGKAERMTLLLLHSMHENVKKKKKRKRKKEKRQTKKD